MTISEWCEKCNNSWKCDDEDTPDCCPYCGYDGNDDDTAGDVDVDIPDDDDRDYAAEWGGVDIPDSRY